MKSKNEKRYGRWSVIGDAPDTDHYTRWLILKCDCGTTKTVRRDHVVHGKSLSCGCLRDELASNRAKKHGKYGSRVYKLWQHIKERCFCKTSKDFKLYGERGITMCEKWKNSFSDFYNDVGDPPDNTSLDRIDNNGNYEPGNVRFVNSIIQGNNKRNNRFLTAFGRRQTISNWSHEFGISRNVIRNRIDKFNWDVERAISEPLRKKTGHYFVTI